MKNLFALMLVCVLCLAQSGAKSGIDRSSFDTSCKPCDDFWRYASGGWMDKNPIPAQYRSWGAASVVQEGNEERLRAILDAVPARGATGDVRRVGDFYASCMDTAGIEQAGVKPIQPNLTRIAAISSRKELVAELVTLEPEGGLTPTTLGNETDLDNASQMIAGVGAGGLSLPDRDYYLNDDDRTKNIRAEFLKHVQQTLELLGDKPDAAAVEAKTVLDFETGLARATLTNVQRRDPNLQFHKMNLAGLEQLAPNYDWKSALKLLAISATAPINVDEPEFVKNFNRTIQEAPLDNWKTWLRWRLINDRSQFLSKAFYDESFRFNQTVLNGVKEQKPRWKTCVAMSDSFLGEALGKLFVAKHFTPDAKRRVTELVENMRAALREQLQAADWLEPETRKNAIVKLDAFHAMIGYPSKWRDYSRVSVDRGKYLANVESAALEERRFQLAKIGKPIDREQWGMTPPTVNAYYNAEKNELVFPAGILQPPFFTADADDAVNYGAIGAIIGHEMGHGFDDQGAKFDANGNLKNWWTEKDLKEFDARASCVTNQFDSIEVGDGLRHKGKLVTGEAMGDLGGITLAYKAYHRALNGKEPPVLDGFTGDQRFFLAFGRIWATQFRPEATRLLLNTNPHPLPKFRADATLQNMPEFHKAFGCKPGDPMVRPAGQQCRLW